MEEYKELIEEAENINNIILKNYTYTEKMVILEMVRQGLMYAKFKDLLEED